MNKNGVTMLSGIQLVVLMLTWTLEMNAVLSDMMRTGLYITLFVLSVLLMASHYQTSSKQKTIAYEMNKAVNGNLKIRLLSKGNYLLDEIVFAVNGLIEQLERVQIQTKRSQAERRSLLSSISHDIRTPLTSMIGYVDALKDDIAATDEEKQEYLAIISRKSKDLKKLIDQMFTIAKLDADEMPMRVEPLDFTELTRETLIEFFPDIKKYDMELKVNIPENKCLILADRISIVRIIGNMIKNAVQYGNEGKVLGINFTETGSTFQLEIWDQGPGISKQDMGHVFERMYRSDHARTPMHGGSGLGLAIAKTLAEKNGGQIWAESAPRKKTSFFFRMPRHK
ncbi:sensor histidine kinase [Paenibacillus durus]|uniref:histidine kinase n=1 Tax=Paenibacillus durus TaxID=44251 RepID=A0A089HP07_PAEDU|nr:HAMP domain-containing sensor histidine kinase [Paenibacillus durus]AIQ12435.1 ATPase [Paenibacillus durus]